MRYSWLFILPIFAIIAIVSYSLYRFYTKKRSIKKVALVSHSKRIRNLPEYEKARVRYRILLVLLIVFFSASMFSITLAASRPISVGKTEPDYSTRDVMLCIDISASMNMSREDLIKHLSNIVDDLEGQKIGITIFAAKASLLMPLTDDYDTLHSTLESINHSFHTSSDLQKRISHYTKIVGSSSNIGGGIVSCIDNFDRLQTEGRSQSLIIATDNQQTEGEITTEKALNYAKRFNINVYSIDTGNTEAGGKTSTDGKDLKTYTLNAGGIYYHLQSGKLSADDVVRSILSLEKRKIENEQKIVQTDSPFVSVIIATVSTLLFMAVIWRIKL